MSAEIILLIAGAAVAGLVQGISGFAFGMVAMSFWVWNIEPRVATVMAVFGGLTGQVLSAITVRRSVPWPTLLPLLVGGLIGLPFGIWLLPRFDPVLFKLVLGIMLVIFCPAMLLANRFPKIKGGGRVADGAAGMVGGVMGGISGFAGLAPSLWCVLRGYDKDLTRSVVQTFNLIVLALSFTGQVVTGAVTGSMLHLFPIVAVSMLLPSFIGARIYKGMSPLAFRNVVLAVLMLAGVTMIAASIKYYLH